MKQFLAFILISASFVCNAQVKIPITTKFVWQDNSQQDRADILLDGSTSVNYTPAGPKTYPNHQIVFDLYDWTATVASVKVSIAGTATCDVSVIVVKKSDESETQIGTFSGGTNQTFTYTHAGTFQVSKVILRANSTNYNFGSEVEIWGAYTAPATPAPHAKSSLGAMTGAVAHSYDLMNDAKLNALKSLNIQNLRVWENAYDVTDASQNWKFEPELGTDRYSTDSALHILRIWKPSIYAWKVTNDQYTNQRVSWDVIDDFPNRYIKGAVNSYTDHGSWGEIMLHVTQVAGADGFVYDAWYVYKSGSLINKTVSPEYLASDLPGQDRHFNVGGGLSISTGDTLYFYKSQMSGNPIFFADNPLNRRSTDSAHLQSGQAMFVYASRGGINASVPNYPIQTTSPAQRMLKGTGFYSAVEPANEADHWWKPFDNFWNGKTIFYLHDMAYDGHKNAFSNTGAKQADSTIDVIMSGLATDKPDQIYAMIDEARKVRGFRADGKIDLPFNVINCHIYPSAEGQYGFGNNGGLPWEQGARSKVKDLVELRDRKAPQCQLMISEWGWDQHPNSSLHAGIFGSYDREAVGAFWMVRAMLTMAMDGVNKTTYYPLFQDWPESGSNTSSTQFATMRLLRQPVDANADSIVRSRQGDYMAQYNEFADYLPYDSIVTGQPWLHAYRYKKATNDSAIVAVWSEEISTIVSDTTHFVERTGTIDVPVKSGSYKLRQFQDGGSTTMSTSTATSSGTVTVSYAAKPVIIQTIIPTRFQFEYSGRLHYKPRE
jgi:hypothetical protein